MRKIIMVINLMFVFLMLLTGCMAMSKIVDNYTACKNDPVCMEKMTQTGNAAQEVAQSVADEMGNDYSTPISVCIGAVVTFFAGAWMGKKKVV